MRIAFLVNSFPPPTLGGAGRIAALQAELLRAAGHEVEVFKPDMAWLEESELMRAFHHLADLMPNTDLAKQILAFNPEVLVTHNLTGCSFVTPGQIQKTGVRWVHVLHDVQLFEPSGQLRNSARITLGQRFWSGLRKRSLGRPDLVLSPTAWLIDEHRRRGLFMDAQVEILPNPGPDPSFVLRMPRDPVQLLFVGRISHDKGVRLMSDLLKSLDVHAQLTVVGIGPDQNEFSGRPNVHLRGQLEPALVREAMSEADILLVPSQIVENQPTVILEAAAIGLPVIASDIGGIRETLGGAGRILPTSDLQAWRQAVEELCDPTVYREVAAAMYDLARRYEPEAYAEKFKYLIAQSTKM